MCFGEGRECRVLCIIGEDKGQQSPLKEGRARWDIGKKFFLVRVESPWHRLLGEAPSPITGSAQGQVEPGLEQPGLVAGVLAHGRRWNDISFKIPPTQTIL